MRADPLDTTTHFDHPRSEPSGDAEAVENMGGVTEMLTDRIPVRDRPVLMLVIQHQPHGTYPGLPGPTIATHLSRAESRSHYAEGTEFHIGSVEMVANTGSYIDTPFHRYPDGHDIASLPLDRIVAVPGVVVDATERIIGPGTFDDTGTWRRAVLIRTGWNVHFGQDDYVGEHPHLTEAAAQRLIDGGAVLVGIDSANIDDTNGPERPVHSLLLANQIPIVEHLTRLDQLPATPFHLYAIPPPIVGVGTFPIRAIARWS